jgi:hypothetical protein
MSLPSCSLAEDLRPLDLITLWIQQRTGPHPRWVSVEDGAAPAAQVNGS